MIGAGVPMFESNMELGKALPGLDKLQLGAGRRKDSY